MEEKLEEKMAPSKTCLLKTSWKGPVKLVNLAPRCCRAHGVEVREDRPCFVLENVLSEEECEALVEATLPSHQRKPVSLIPGVRSQFSAKDPDLTEMIWRRVSFAMPKKLDGGTIVGLEPKWRHARYFPGQSVMAHMDFRRRCRELEDKFDGVLSSRISFTIYLNEKFTRGETSFVTGLRDDGTFREEFLPNVPKTGSAICFYQCIPEFSHVANVVKGGHKSIMRADVIYEFPDKKTADVGGLNADGGRRLQE